LVDLADGNRRDHGELGVGARGAAAAVINGAVAFRRLVDDDEEFALMAGLVAFACSHASIPVRDAGMRGRPDTSTPRQARTKPTISLTCFMVSAAILRARAAPSTRIESMCFGSCTSR